MRSKVLALLALLALVATVAGYWWMNRVETTYKITGVHADGDDVVIAYWRDDGGELRTTHVARWSVTDEALAWELELDNGRITHDQQGMLLRERTLVVADQPATDGWRVRGLDKRSGAIRWTRELPGRRARWLDLVGNDTHVFAVGDQPRLWILSVESGEVTLDRDFNVHGPPLFNDRLEPKRPSGPPPPPVAGGWSAKVGFVSCSAI